MFDKQQNKNYVNKNKYLKKSILTLYEWSQIESSFTWTEFERPDDTTGIVNVEQTLSSFDWINVMKIWIRNN